MSLQTFRSTLGLSPSKASINDSTLIIIDAQNEYAHGNLAVSNLDPSRKVITDLLHKYRSSDHNGRNIVHIIHVTSEDTPIFTTGTDLVEEFDELKPEGDEKVVEKRFPSSFGQTDLGAYLAELGDVGKKIVLVGYMAHVCVSTTARVGHELGYDVLIVKDAIGDRDVPGAKAQTLVDVVLAELGDVFGTVIEASEISA